MEIVALVVLVAAVAIFFLLTKSERADPAPPPSASRRPAPAVVQTPRFDARSAQHLEKPRVLSGPAWVTDGDTITINKTQIRLFGIDAPELNHPYGVRAKRALMRFCKGQIIRAEVTDEDHHGRTVARCFLPDGRDLSAEMVKLGLALDWPKFSGGKYRGLEVPEARRKLFLADARQKGRMHVWEQFEARQRKS